MKINFIKNILVFIFSMIAVLIYFKLLAYYIDVDTLAKYFKIKAFGMIIFYLFSIRYSELAYIMRAEHRYSLYTMNKIYLLYMLFVVLLTSTLLIIINILPNLLVLFIFSYIIFLLNDLIDSYIAINRLFHKYFLIILYKALLLFKPLLVYFLYINRNIDISVKSLITFELYFHLLFALLMIYVVYQKVGINNLLKYTNIYKQNIENIKNTWLGSVSKIPYEALPTYLLSLFTGGVAFVEYNVARKVYAMTNFANQPFLQILNTYSIDMKENYKKYLFLYYTILIILNLLIGATLYFFGYEIITILSKSMYATGHTLILIYIMFFLYSLYLMIYPIRQYIVITKKIIVNNQALRMSIIILLCSTIIFIPLYETYAISVIQPLGLILPIVITVILLKKR